jgi:hypothetical protein
MIGENPNWTEVLGSVAAAINSQCMATVRMTSHHLRQSMDKFFTMNYPAPTMKLSSAGQFHYSYVWCKPGWVKNS